MQTNGAMTPTTTTDATPKVLQLLNIPENAAYTGKVFVKGITAAGTMFVWQADVAARRSLTAAVQFVNTTPQQIKDTALNACAIALQGGADTLNVQVTGIAGTTINWHLAYSGDVAG